MNQIAQVVPQFNDSSASIPDLSFVIPAHNEEDTIVELFTNISNVCNDIGKTFEVIFVDDGSTDQTWHIMEQLALTDPSARAIRFRRNFGKARGLAVGFEEARGAVVFTMDADLQDDAKEIPRFLAKLDEGFDLVSGYKQKRHDPWHKVLPSRVFNAMLSRLGGVRLHDHNCGFKCYRAAVVKEVTLYGEMHRMVPCLAAIRGFSSSEIVVTHHPRMFGVSKYGIRRFLRGFCDMITVSWLRHFRERPLHNAAGVAALAALVAFACIAVAFMVSGTAGLVIGLLGAAAAAQITPVLAVGVSSELSLFERERTAKAVAETARAGFRKQEVQSRVAVELPPEVLVVDDDAVSRMVLARELRHRGCNITQAGSIGEALSRATAATRVVLLDLYLPDADGLDGLARLHTLCPEAKIIMMSSERELMTVRAAFRQGAFDYIPKPELNASLDQVTLLLRTNSTTKSEGLQDRNTAMLS